MSDSPHDAATLLEELGAGRTGAAEELLPIVYEELRRLASGYLRQQRVGHTLQPTALVHEAYVKLIANDAGWQSRDHFLAVAATAMRQILINHARDRRAAKRGGGEWARVTLDEALAQVEMDGLDAIDLDEALTALAKEDERQARIVELRVFASMSIDDVARVLDVGMTTVKSDWLFARAWLKRRLGAGDTG